MIPQTPPQTVAARMAAGERLTLLDVREDWELAIAVLPGIVHIPMGDIPDRWAELDASAPTVVICRSGMRSQQVAHFLRAQGFVQVENLAGGILAWARELDPTLTAY